MRVHVRPAFLLGLCMLASAIEIATAQTVAKRKTLTYSNSREGISFGYPVGFVLKSGDLAKTDDIGLGYLGPLPMAFVQHDGVRIATVEIPASFYPKSDFVNAFFSVSVHDGMTPGQCEQFASVQESPKAKSVEIHGVTFLSIDDGGAGMSHQFGATYYHALVGGRCYEISYGVATAGCGALDGITCVKYQAIIARLEAVARTVRVTAQKRRPAPAPK